jgi:hypothetical protein
LQQGKGETGGEHACYDVTAMTLPEAMSAARRRKRGNQDRYRARNDRFVRVGDGRPVRLFA